MARIYDQPKKMERQSERVAFLFLKKNAFSTKGRPRVVSLNDVDKMLNAFTMHSFFTTMLRNHAVTMPLGIGAFLIYTQGNNLIHLFTNLNYSL